MSKTIQIQIDKSQTLINGLRKNMPETAQRGISNSELDEMAAELTLLDQANKECDAIREDLSKKVKHMNEILNKVKTSFADKKKVIKGYYSQEDWQRFGVLDKR